MQSEKNRIVAYLSLFLYTLTYKINKSKIPSERFIHPLNTLSSFKIQSEDLLINLFKNINS